MSKLNQFPKTGWCKSLDERLINFLKKKYPNNNKYRDERDNFIAWSISGFWYVKITSYQHLYELEQLEPFLEQKKYDFEVVYCTTQEEWDFVLGKIKLERTPSFSKFNCVDLTGQDCYTLQDCQFDGDKIYSFQEWCTKFNHEFLKPEYLYTETPDEYIVKTYNGKIGYTNYICGKDFYHKYFNDDFKWEGYRNATQEEIEWLEACIKQDKFVPKKEYQVGKWYKIVNNWYAKFKNIHSQGAKWQFSEKITASGQYFNETASVDIIGNIELLTDLSEIQEYLPFGHVDKIAKNPEYAECIEERKGYYGELNKVYKVKTWHCSNEDCLLEGTTSGSTCRKRFKPSTKEAFDLQNNPQEDLLEIARKKYPIGTKFKSSYIDSDKIYTVNKELQWWNDSKTDIIVGISGASVYTKGKWAEIIEEETLLEKAKRLYPVGTKFKNIYGKPSENVVSEMDHDFESVHIIPDNITVSVKHPDECLKWSIYSKEKGWAEIIPEVKTYTHTQEKATFDKGIIQEISKNPVTIEESFSTKPQLIKVKQLQILN